MRASCMHMPACVLCAWLVPTQLTPPAASYLCCYQRTCPVRGEKCHSKSVKHHHPGAPVYVVHGHAGAGEASSDCCVGMCFADGQGSRLQAGFSHAVACCGCTTDFYNNGFDPIPEWVEFNAQTTFGYLRLEVNGSSFHLQSVNSSGAHQAGWAACLPVAC